MLIRNTTMKWCNIVSFVKSFGISTWRMFTMWKSTVCDIHMRWELSGVSNSNSVCVFKLWDEILRNSFVSIWAIKSFEILNSVVMSWYKIKSESEISFLCIFRSNINVVQINLSLISRLAHINMCNRNTDPRMEWMSFSVSVWASSSSEIVQ